MKRGEFLKKLGICAIVVPITPKVLADTFAKEEKPVLPDINGELVELSLFNNGRELTNKKYARQTVAYRIKAKNKIVYLDMPDVVFDIEGRADIDEVRIFHKETGQDWGNIIYGNYYSVMDGKFTICWNG